MKYENSLFPEQVCMNIIYMNISLGLASQSIEQRSSFKNIGHITEATLLKRQRHLQRKNNKQRLFAPIAKWDCDHLD